MFISRRVEESMRCPFCERDMANYGVPHRTCTRCNIGYDTATPNRMWSLTKEGWVKDKCRGTWQVIPDGVLVVREME